MCRTIRCMEFVDRSDAGRQLARLLIGGDVTDGGSVTVDVGEDGLVLR